MSLVIASMDDSSIPSTIPRIIIPITTRLTARYCGTVSFSFRKILASIAEQTQYDAMTGAATMPLPERAYT